MKPTHLGDDSFRADYSSKKDMRWLNISEGEIIEIEICKSGKVYWYKS